MHLERGPIKPLTKQICDQTHQKPANGNSKQNGDALMDPVQPEIDYVDKLFAFAFRWKCDSVSVRAVAILSEQLAGPNGSEENHRIPVPDAHRNCFWHQADPDNPALEKGISAKTTIVRLWHAQQQQLWSHTRAKAKKAKTELNPTFGAREQRCC
jgi:hypothetical protein